jgi:predicted site-specific integrase-resolvase
MTVQQAAAHVGRSERTIQRWIRQGRLTAVTHPLLDHQWVDVDELLDAERTTRQTQYATRFGTRQETA